MALAAAVVVNGLECVCQSVRRDAGRGTEGGPAAGGPERERAVAAAAEAFLIVQDVRRPHFWQRPIDVNQVHFLNRSNKSYSIDLPCILLDFLYKKNIYRRCSMFRNVHVCARTRKWHVSQGT